METKKYLELEAQLDNKRERDLEVGKCRGGLAKTNCVN